MSEIFLESIIANGNKVDYYFNIAGDIQKYFNPRNHMFMKYNYDISDVPESILAIPFIANVIPLVWITQSTIKVSQLDKSFYECLGNIKIAYQNMYPNVKFGGSIDVGEIIENIYYPEHQAASLFSGGLDALTTFIRIKDKYPILITEYAWHEDTIQESDVWEADKENALIFAKYHGLKNILVESNYGNFIKANNIDNDFHRKLGDSWWHGLHHGLAIISASIPMAFKFKVKCIYIASSNSPTYKVTCASDPTVDNEIKFASGMVYHDAYELNRQEKTKIIVDYYSSNAEPSNIRVCFKNQENCCSCEKCLRTIMGIIAEGKNPNDYGFMIPKDFSNHLKNFLNQEVKFFTKSFIEIYWKIIQNRMKENHKIIIYQDLLEWFIDYNFIAEQKKSLIKYRITNFFPILERKIRTNLSKIFQLNG